MSIQYQRIIDGQVCDSIKDHDNIEQLSFHYKDDNAVVFDGSEVSDSVLFQLCRTDFLFVVANYVGGQCIVHYLKGAPFIRKQINQNNSICS